MRSTPASLRNLARRLLALEASPGKTRDAEASAAFRVCEKLRQPLSTLAGVAGFRSLLSRALALAGEVDAKRLVIDSLVGFEMALAPGFRTDFRESLYRMMASLTGTGVTVLSTVELDESFTEFRFSHYMVSFLADDIIRLRYLDLDGVLHRILTVVKMRDSQHSKDICEYAITEKGVVLTGRRLNEYRALITGIPAYWSQSGHAEEP